MSKKIVITLVVVFVLLLGMMGTGFFFMWNKLNAVNAQQTEPDQGEGTAQAEPLKIGPLHPLDTFIVNLADEGGNRYLRTTLNLEMKDEESGKIVQERLPVIRNTILMLLPTKTYDDIATVEGKTALRDEILARLNTFLTPGSVANIYFTEFVVQ
jgi:flagellar FliL protein